MLQTNTPRVVKFSPSNVQNRRTQILSICALFIVMVMSFTLIAPTTHADASVKDTAPAFEATGLSSERSPAIDVDALRLITPEIGERYTATYKSHSWSAGFDSADFRSVGYCVDINNANPNIGDVYEVVAPSTLGINSQEEDLISRILRAVEDSAYANLNDADLDADINRAVWRVTDGSSISGLPLEIYNKAANGTYQSQPVIFLENISDSGRQPVVALSGVKDYGDAPVSYDEAFAFVSDTISLGLTTDDEKGQLYSSDANGDDNNGSNDDDGVDFLDGNAGVVGEQNQISITVVNTQSNNDGVYVSGWIDFNADGDFLDAGEQIIVDEAVSTSSTPQKAIYTYSVPADAVAGTTFARFRVSDYQNASPTGIAPGAEPLGEVEDYMVTLKAITGSISDTIWLDDNGNGNQDAGELGIPNVTVILRNANGSIIDSDVTDSDGKYFFGGLVQGTYRVSVDTSTLPVGYGPTYDADGLGSPDQSVYILGTGENNVDQDFGYQPLSFTAVELSGQSVTGNSFAVASVALIVTLMVAGTAVVVRSD